MAHGSMLASVYLWVVALVSIGLLAALSSTSQAQPVNLGLAAELVLLAVIAQHFPLPVRPQHKTDVSIAAYFACLLLFDTSQAVVLVGLGQMLGQATLALRTSPDTGKRMRGRRGVLFNTSQLVLATTLGSLVYNWLLPHSGSAPLDRPENLWALPAAALAMQMTNTGSVSVMVSLQLQQSPREVLLSAWRLPGLDRAGLFVIGLIAALAGGQSAWAPLVMAFPAGIVFLSQRRSVELLASEQRARAEAEQAQRYFRLLANASAALAASLDYTTTLECAVCLATPTLADSCSISIGRGQFADRWFSVASEVGSLQGCLGELMRHCPSAPHAEDGVKSELYPVVTEADVLVWSQSSDCARLIRDVGPLSAMLIPLVARGQTLGGLALYARLSRKTYSPEDLAVAEDLANRIALTIDNARLYEEQQRVVGRLQRVRGRLETSERVKLVDDERDRIARELHDRVEQAFFGIGLRVNALLANSVTSHFESLHGALAEIRTSAKQGSDDLRAAIFALTRGEVHDLGLVRALAQLVQEFQEKTGVEADLVVSGPERRVSPQIAEVLHAVAREGLANVEQHAQASAVVVGLRFEPDAVILTVQDDGVGASTLVMSTLSESATRFGLSGTNERVVRLGGTFTAQSGEEGGFVVRAHVPLCPPAITAK